LYQPVAGLMLPAVAGFATVVNKYCVVKLAVYVTPAAAVTVCAIAPPSDQLEKVSCVPVEGDCGDVVAMVCWLPTPQLNVQGAVHAAPSTAIDAPVGLLAMDTPVNTTKFAVTLTGPFITTSYEDV
jgi:hypothetical protein